MANYEHYSSEEYVSCGEEYRHFEAEVYARPQEIKADIPEVRDTGSESRFAAPPTTQAEPRKRTSPSKTKQGAKRSKLKELFDTISKSTTKVVGSVVGTVAAATSVVVVCTGFFTAKPQVTPMYLESGGDYVSYGLEITDLHTDVDYDLVISTPFNDFTYVEEEVFEGKNEHIVTGLRAGYEYILSLVGDSGDATGEVTYYKTTFYTEKGGEEIGGTYGGTLSFGDMKDTYVEWGDTFHAVTLPITFTTEDVRYGYRVELLDEAGQTIGKYVGRESRPTLTVPSDAGQVTLRYETLTFGDHIEYAHECVILEEPLYFGVPQITFLADKQLVATGEYYIPFIIESPQGKYEVYEEITIHCGGEEVFYSTSAVANRIYYMTAWTDGTPGSMEFTATMTYQRAYGGSTVTLQMPAVTYQNEVEFKDTVYVSYQYGSEIYMDFAVCAPEGAYMEVYDAVSGEAVPISGYSHTIAIESGVYAYRYRLMAADGTPLTPEKTVAFDTTTPMPVFEADYPNPGDVLLTHNPDGTLNFYIPTGFSCEDEHTYYEIELRRRDEQRTTIYRVRDSIAVFENLPYDNYYLSYTVVHERDGERYVLAKVAPSGGIEPDVYSYGELTAADDSLTIEVFADYLIQDPILVIVNGVQVASLSLTDMTLTEGGYSYTYTLDVGVPIESASMILGCGPSTFVYNRMLEKLGDSDLIGSLYRTKEIILGG